MDKKNFRFGGLSSALLREIFKQQWYVPALLFILYFLSGIFPVLMMDRETRGPYAAMSLANNNFFFGAFIAFTPIIAACIVMRYYHSPSMAFALNSQPYSRGKLFNTNIFAGWLFMVIPVLLTGLIYMAVSGSIESPIYGDGSISWEQAYTVKDALIWVVESVSLYTFYFGLSVLAGSLVGNTVTQILGSMVFYLVVPALAGIVLLFSEVCLPGYNAATDGFWRLIMYSQPLLGEALSSAVQIALPDRIWYLAAGALLLIIAGSTCKKARLEKVGDSMIFRPVEAVVAVVITFIGGAIIGLLFGFVFDSSLPMFLLGALLGGAISFFLVKIILARSVRIFNGTNLKTFIAAILITFIFVSCFVLDITGYGAKVPEDGSIASVNIKGVSENVLRLNDYDMYDSEAFYIKDKVFTEDRDIIGKVSELHRYVADNKLYDIKDGETSPSIDLEFEYVLNNGKTFSRQFEIRVDEKAEKMLRDIANDEAVTVLRQIPETLRDSATRVEFDIDIWKNDEDTEYRFGMIPGSGRKDIIRLVDTYNADKKDDVVVAVANTYEEVPYEEYEGSEGSLGEEVIYAYLTLYYKSSDVDQYERNSHYNDYEPCVRVGVGKDDKETMALLMELYEKYPADSEG